MNKLTYVTINFESVEAADVNAADIKIINLSGITDTISWVHGCLYTMHQCEMLYFELLPSANTKMKEPYNGATLFERITKFNDIVSAVLHFDDGTENEIYTKWNSINDEDNSFQSSVILSNGNILVVCSQNETAEALKQKYEKPIKYMGIDAY